MEFKSKEFYDTLEYEEYSCLKLCAKGYCNKKIALLLGLSEYQVRGILVQYYNFPGWETELIYNPLDYYYACEKGYKCFETRLLILPTTLIDYWEIETAFMVCDTYDNLCNLRKGEI